MWQRQEVGQAPRRRASVAICASQGNAATVEEVSNQAFQSAARQEARLRQGANNKDEKRLLQA